MLKKVILIGIFILAFPTFLYSGEIKYNGVCRVRAFDWSNNNLRSDTLFNSTYFDQRIE